MAKFFIQNPEIRKEFDKLPAEVKTRIMETDVQINSVEELDQIAQCVEQSFR